MPFLVLQPKSHSLGRICFVRTCFPMLPSRGEHACDSCNCMQMAEATEREQVSTKAATVDHNMMYMHDFMFNQLMPANDSTKFVFNLILDSLTPFMGSYFQVCMHA